MEDEIFILASTDTMPDRFLHGYAFDGADLICGNEGYHRFRTARRKMIDPGEDGGYAVVNTTGNKTTIGTDYTGNYKLYLYRHQNFWAISNSLIELAKFARSKGQPVTVNTAQLASFLIYPRRFGDQLSSFSTSVREISFIPARFQIEITKSVLFNKLEVELVPEAARFQTAAPDYQAQMSRFLSVWIGRFAAILTSDIEVTIDVTGGLDSRVVLSLVLKAAEIVGPETLGHIHFNTRTSKNADHLVAHRLAATNGFEISQPKSGGFNDYHMDTEPAYQLWRQLFPGTYMPVIMTSIRREPNFIWVAGNGGEVHRPDYQFDSLEALLDNGRQFFVNQSYFEEIRETTLADVEKVRIGQEAGLHPVLSHYRNFRDRFHHGRRALVCNAITPLSSYMLRFVNNVASPEMFKTGRILTDVITNCRPALFEVPFDDPSKKFGLSGAFSEAQAEQMISAVDTGGTVYFGPGSSLPRGSFRGKIAMQLLRQDFLDTVTEARNFDFFSRDYLEMAGGFLDAAQGQRAFSLSRHGSPAAHVIFAAELLKIASA